MPTPKQPSVPLDKAEFYGDLAVKLRGLLASESDLIANSANMAALLFHALPELNWAGFYFLRGKELVLGPFQGRPACLRIAIGKGVCGSAARRGETILVEDLNDVPGLAAGDSTSRSALAVPLIESGECLGVLALDSEQVGRFDEDDKEGCEALAGLFLAHQRALGIGPAPSAIRRRGTH